jgi:threonyl-tRNA synthetase
LKRSYQCATVQLISTTDPIWFKAFEDKATKRFKVPVIIHRAIYGSLERFTAILTEHYAGKFPSGSPRQIHHQY